MPQPDAVAGLLGRCATAVHALAVDLRESRRSPPYADEPSAEVERTAASARAAVRGRG